jgi:short-subunit dehydrogenase
MNHKQVSEANLKVLKYALVTGASSGIGKQISLELTQRGYDIIAVSNQENELERLKLELNERYGKEPVTINIDLSNPESANYVHDFCTKQGLKVEILVNNAGQLVLEEAINLRKSESMNIMQLHMHTPVQLCQLFGKEMTQRKGDYILNVSSISAVMPYPKISLYGPTKTFIRYFTKALRMEMKPHYVHVTCLIPGATGTALLESHKLNVPVAKKLGIIRSPERVARSGVRALFNDQSECVPGFLNKLTMWIVPLIPTSIIVLIYKKILSNRRTA